MKVLYVMVGIPGSGKTSYVSSHLSNCISVSSDLVRQELFGDAAIQYSDAYLQEQYPHLDLTKMDEIQKRYLCNRDVFARVETLIASHLQNGEDVVYDATSVSRKLRRAILEKQADNCRTAVAVIMDTPAEMAVKRDRERSRQVGEAVIHYYAGMLEYPNKAEGFTSIRYIHL